MTPTSAVPPLETYLLGLVDFEDAQRLQRRLVYDLGERPGGALILCEHPPTISVGRSGSRMHIVPDDEALRSLGIRVHWVNRGGGCLLHLPGQLVVYFAFSGATLPKLFPSWPSAITDVNVGIVALVVNVVVLTVVSGVARGARPAGGVSRA